MIPVFFGIQSLIDVITFYLGVIVNMPERMRATITAVKPQFLQKCITFNVKMEDAINPKLYTNFNVFVPKLTPKYITPCVFTSISNGRSSVLFRTETPKSLKFYLKKVIELTETALFKERWERITDHSERLISNGYLAAYDSLYFVEK